jgi:hypothetical protein
VLRYKAHQRSNLCSATVLKHWHFFPAIFFLQILMLIFNRE